MKQSKIAISVVLVMVMAITLQGCGSNNDKISVKTAVPRMGEIVAEYDISGALSPLETVEISAPFSGKVASVGVAVGDKVAKGQVLLNLDTSQLRIQLQQAEATYHNAQSQSHSVKEQASINLSNAKA
ncbi:MAG: biotin/lipoyl-binding protein, partial [Anaerovorax sp.]